MSEGVTGKCFLRPDESSVDSIVVVERHHLGAPELNRHVFYVRTHSAILPSMLFVQGCRDFGGGLLLVIGCLSRALKI